MNSATSLFIIYRYLQAHNSCPGQADTEAGPSPSESTGMTHTQDSCQGLCTTSVKLPHSPFFSIFFFPSKSSNKTGGGG